jgi:hypothetical protein
MSTSGAYLLVEGKNDRHVVWALCKTHQLPDIFAVETPGVEEGIEALLRGLSLRLSAEDLRILGVMVDADQDLLARWQAVRDRLHASGYVDVPVLPPADGWVSTIQELPRTGVWIMPDNQVSGILEDFVARLIPPNDVLRPKAEEVVSEIEQAGLNRYHVVHHPQALIHTWLAWQEFPGMPIGQAITAHALHHNSPIAFAFVAWLRRLFEIPAAE